MLLVIDVGNTNTAIGVFSGKRLESDWRLATNRYRTADEWGQLICNLLQMEGTSGELIRAVAIACVVPPLVSVLQRMCHRYFKLEGLFVDSGTALGMPIRYQPPQDVGADRIVNAIAAEAKHGTPAIIVDFGTATTFDAVSAQGEYIGGVICPGVGISADALFEMAARLPRVDIVKPGKVIGSDTVGSMQAGLYYGYLEQAQGIIERMRAEIEGEVRVILTGGYARVFAAGMGDDVIHDPILTLDGLRLAYERSSE